jgi:hypothetical protein
MRNLLGLAAAAATFLAVTQWLEAQCEVRWRASNATAYYSLRNGCMVSFGDHAWPEANVVIDVPALRRVIE